MNDNAQADASSSRLCVVLACFDDAKGASKIRRALGKQIRASGGATIDEVLLRVGAGRKVRIYDPAKVLRGGATAGLTWGLFGLVTGGLRGLLIWGVLGVPYGALIAYYTEHTLSKQQLRHIGESLPLDSSAMLGFIAANDADRVLAAMSAYAPAAATVGAVQSDLSACVTGGNAAASTTNGEAISSMLLFRYKGQHAVKGIVEKLTPADGKPSPPVKTELAIEVDAGGKSHVHNPGLGVAHQTKSDMLSWGLFGLGVGALSGVIGGGGISGAFKAGIALLIGWGIFGAGAGMLYGLWVGRGTSARRLRILGPLLPPNTSLLLAWADSVPSLQTIGELSTPDTDRLILAFRAVPHGAALEVA